MISSKAFSDFCRQVISGSTGLKDVDATIRAIEKLRGPTVVVIPKNIDVVEGKMDARDAIEEVRRLKAEAERQIASDMTNVLFDLEGRTGMNAHGVRVEMTEITNMQDERPRFIVSRVEIDLGRI